MWCPGVGHLWPRSSKVTGKELFSHMSSQPYFFLQSVDSLLMPKTSSYTAHALYVNLLNIFHPHQIVIEIIDASSVITWDFDVCKGDIVFNIYHSKRAPQVPRKDTLGAHGITSPGGNNVQLIDKSWTLGQDYSMVESPLTCKEGESVQVGLWSWTFDVFLDHCYFYRSSFLLVCTLNPSSGFPHNEVAGFLHPPVEVPQHGGLLGHQPAQSGWRAGHPPGLLTQV